MKTNFRQTGSIQLQRRRSASREVWRQFEDDIILMIQAHSCHLDSWVGALARLPLCVANYRRFCFSQRRLSDFHMTSGATSVNADIAKKHERDIMLFPTVYLCRMFLFTFVSWF